MQLGRNRAGLRGPSARRSAGCAALATLVVAGLGSAALVRSAPLATSVLRPDPGAEPAALISAVPRPTSPVRLVVLGDSVASGAGCSCEPFGQLLSTSLAAVSKRPVTFTNAARDGLTTQGLLDQLQGPVVERALTSATLVTVTIGANDFDPDLADNTDCLGPSAAACFRSRLTSYRALLRAVLARLRTQAPASRILVTGYWNVFLDGDVGWQHGQTYVQVSDALTKTVNAEIAQQASAVGATYVDLYVPFEQQSLSGLTALLAPDGDHPSASGHQLISRTLFDAAAQPAR